MTIYKDIMIKDSIIKICIILGPTYTTAWISDKMIYVIPMLAVCTLIAATYDDKTKRRIEEDGFRKDLMKKDTYKKDENIDYGSRENDG